tara:strand:- start:15408 stop:16016 length:609 start_codon:yes stop_codon:yes gene_type:complete
MVRINLVKAGETEVITSDDKDVSVDVKPTVSIKVMQSNVKTHVFELNARESLDGNIMIFDHKDIDIVLMQEKKKIVAFAKEMLTDNVYGAESRMFEFLKKKGIVAYDSIQGGNIYGSMEAQILESKKFNPVKSALVNIAQWFKEETPMMKGMEAYDQMMDDTLLQPDREHSTELGEVPQAADKGSIVTNNMFAPYLYGRYTY